MMHVAKHWRAILRRTYTEYGDDQVSIVASGVAFRVVIAAFPGIALLVWIGTRLIGPDESQALLQAVTGVLPEASRSVLAQAVQSSLRNNPADNAGQAGMLGIAAPLAGLLFTLWSTNSGMKALFNALNVIYDTEERRSFVRFTAITLLFTIGTLFSIFVTTLLVLAGPTLLAAAGLSGFHLFGLTLLRWPVLFVGLAVSLALLYRYAPHRERDSWPLLTFGSSLASLLVVLSSALFSWFTDRFASFAVTYGSLSTVIAFMLWLWISFWVVLVCAELDSCIQRETGLYGGGQPESDGASG